MEIRDLEPKFREGFKLDYSKIKKAVMQCELDKKSNECKNALKEIGVEWID